MKILLLVIENRDYILTEYTKWITGIAWDKEVEGILYWNSKRKPIWYMRQKMIEQFLQSEATHALFVDTDTVLPQGAIKKLASHKCDMVSAIYYDTIGRPNSIKGGKYYQGKGLEEVDVFGMGASLISREVLEKVKYPKAKDTIDSDVLFCKAVKKAGFKVMQDFNIRASHFLLGKF